MGVGIFIHGLESGNQGTKSVFFRENFPGMIIPNFTGSLHERMASLNEVLHGRDRIKIVGSSYGGLMATLFAMENEKRVDGMVLLAPAINHLPSATGNIVQITVPVRIYHGMNDDVIPLHEMTPLAEKIFTELTLHTVDDDHFLHSTFKKIDWATFLA